MASPNYILVNGTSTRANTQARQAIDALQNAKNQINKLAGTLSQANADGAALLATDLGLTSDDAATLNSLIGSASTDLNASGAIAQLLSRCG